MVQMKSRRNRQLPQFREKLINACLLFDLWKKINRKRDTLALRNKNKHEGVQLENVFAKLGLIKCSVHFIEIALPLLRRDETVCVHI